MDAWVENFTTLGVCEVVAWSVSVAHDAHRGLGINRFITRCKGMVAIQVLGSYRIIKITFISDDSSSSLPFYLHAVMV